MVEERLAELAVLSSGVVLTIVTNTSGHSTASLVNGLVKVTAGRVLVTVTSSAGVGLLTHGRFPGQVVVEVLALLAVLALRVVGTLALAVNHFRFAEYAL